MLGTLTLAATLAIAPSQPAGLNLTNVRTTYGELGPPRTDNKFMPGDVFFVAYDIEGITVGNDGKISYMMSMEVTDKAGKVVYKPEKPAESEEVLPLGGSRLPARAFVFLKPDQEPGAYMCKVTVTDKATKASKVLEKAFDVVPKAFGIFALQSTADADGKQPAPPFGVVGQNLFVHCGLMGISRGADKKPNAQCELRVYDANKQPTLSTAIAASVPKELPDDEPALFRFLIPFNREGTFTVELKATDNANGKTSVVTFPLRVVGR